MKKIAIGIIILLIAVLGYIILSNKNNPNETPGNTSSGKLPNSEEEFVRESPQKPAVLSEQNTTEGQISYGIFIDSPVKAYKMASESSAYLIGENGSIEKKTGSSMETVLPASSSLPVLKAGFSADAKFAYAIMGTKNNPTISIADITKRAWLPLKIYPVDAAWSPDSKSLAILGALDGNMSVWLIKMDDKKPTPAKIVDFSVLDGRLYFRDAQSLLIYKEPSSKNSGKVWELFLKNKTISPITIDNYGLSAIGNSSATLIYSGSEEGRGLYLYKNDLVPIKLPFLTLPEKCAIKNSASSTSLVCAIPRNQTGWDRRDMPDSYWRSELQADDDIAEYSISKESVSPIFNNNYEPFDAIDIQVLGSVVAFKNKLDNKVYAIITK